ncbi:MAG: transporter substrate-binding domain-containing protein [Campylobacteraceae bacterium]
MKKILLAFLLIFGINAFADDIELWKKSTLNSILNKKVLVVGMEPGYMPFEMKSKRGEIIGFDVDIAREMANALGVELKLVPTEWDGIVASLVTGKFDIIISAMTVTSERNLKVNFANPYVEIGQTLLVQKKHAGKSWQELDKSEFTLVTKLGVTPEIVARRMFKNAKIKTFTTQAEAVQEVLNGNADIFIYDKPFNDMFMLDKGKGLLVHLPDELTYEPLGWAVRKGDPDFLNWLNNFLNQIKHDGTYDRIHKKWFVDDKWLSQIQ